MEQANLVHPSAFCWNPQCTDYGKVDLGNIRRFGRTQASPQRYQCRTCNGTFVETIGTVFYGRHHTQETIIECLALLAERNSLAAIHRVKGVKDETVLAWLRLAAQHLERIEAILLANYRLTRAHLAAGSPELACPELVEGSKLRPELGSPELGSPELGSPELGSPERSRRVEGSKGAG